MSGSVQAAIVTARNATIQALLGCPKKGTKRAKRWRSVLFTEAEGELESLLSEAIEDLEGLVFVTGAELVLA